MDENKLNIILKKIWDYEYHKEEPHEFIATEFKHIGNKYYRFSTTINDYVRVYKKHGFNIKPPKED